jgi:excinuclease ABC subunit B
VGARARGLPPPGSLRSPTSPLQGEVEGKSRAHKPALDEMGIALYHEVAPHRTGAARRSAPRKPNLDEMGPGVEAVPGKRAASGPRSTLGRPGMRGGWKPRRR